MPLLREQNNGIGHGFMLLGRKQNNNIRKKIVTLGREKKTGFMPSGGERNTGFGHDNVRWTNLTNSSQHATEI